MGGLKGSREVGEVGGEDTLAFMRVAARGNWKVGAVDGRTQGAGSGTSVFDWPDMVSTRTSRTELNCFLAEIDCK